MEFSKLGLETLLCKHLEAIGFTTPTLIQEKSIPYSLRRQDVIGLAQTGTGKTAAFLLPILSIQQNKFQKARQPSVLILVPTRELATQVMDTLSKFDPKKLLRPVVLIGGDPMGMQERSLKKPHNIVIATPGRLLDFLERGKVMLYGVQQVVIDEADRMLDMGFIPDIDRILASLPKTRQTLLFSATMAPDIKKLVSSYMVLPKTIEVRGETKSKASIEQKVVMVDSKNKREALREILNRHEGLNCVIFCNRKTDIDILESSLRRHKFKASGLHGGMSQDQRSKTLSDFKSGELSIIIASNVLARGVDIEGLGMVINFNAPYQVEDYIHRIGRTGRADLKGIAYTLVDKSEIELLANVEKHLKTKLEFEVFKTVEKPKASKLEEPKKETAKVNTAPKVINIYEPIIGFGENVPAFMLRKNIVN
jgi:superfamily II DNA/RNA helicase